ncbi:metallophosphoesterase [Clostridium bornimense]|uniref:metallophosphoesterase n=1 Tax=Clostridium bornimense TaxID=1216932 RepID=UPI001C107DB7|nr:metallophosphoesterase [Clostridium bornimense]MBU5314837.1 metallophosphoesterase [Clostridium bornimense]
MKIVVLSDTHGDNYCIYKSLEYIKTINPDIVLHLGDNTKDVEIYKRNLDIPIENVRGNCDFSSSAENEKIIELCGKRIFITHGHFYGVKEGVQRLLYRGLELKVDIVLYGHTHISNIIFEEGIWIVNPGSVSLPRKGQNSLATIDIEGDKITPSIMLID